MKKDLSTRVESRLRRMVKIALAEDHAHNDISTLAVGGIGKKSQAQIIARQNGILCGMPVAMIVFKTIDAGIEVRGKFSDGARVSSGDIIMETKGSASAILRGERTALNFLSHLSGIATLTDAFVNKLRGTSTKLLDTRKTMPLLRDLEKYAVLMGGGNNHRRDLSDMYLLKENHIAAAGGLKNALRATIGHRKRVTSRRRAGAPKIEVEVTGLNEFKIALEFDIDRIMLDNFTPAMVKRVVAYATKNFKSRKKIELEVSGGINLSNIRGYALTGIDYISVGALTHSAKAFDLSLKIK